MSCWRYRVVVEGELDTLSASRFEDVDISFDEGCSVLTTVEIDQATLNGLLDRLRHLGVPLVAVVRDTAGEQAGGAIPQPG